MRRQHVHLGFALLLAGCAVMAAWNGWQWHQRADLQSRIGQALAATAAPPGDAALAATRATEDEPPALRAAQALALVRQGRYDDAVARWRSLLQRPDPAWRGLALYDLSTTLLRQALTQGPEGAARGSPLVEVAKQGYRELLRTDSSDWDARYNLELALRISPEVFEDGVADRNTPTPALRVRVPQGGYTLDLP